MWVRCFGVYIILLAVVITHGFGKRQETSFGVQASVAGWDRWQRGIEQTRLSPWERGFDQKEKQFSASW